MNTRSLMLPPPSTRLPTLTDVGVTWLYGYQFEIKVIARLPETIGG